MDPDSIEITTVLDDFTHHRGEARKAAVRTARTMIQHQAAEPNRLVTELASQLQADDIYRRRGAAELLAAVAVDDASLVQSEVDQLSAALTDPITISYAEHALAAIGRETPQKLVPAIESIETVLESSAPDRQDAALHLLEYVVPVNSDVVESHLVARLLSIAMTEPASDHTSQEVDQGERQRDYRRQKRAIGILAAIAETDPERFRDQLPTIAERFPHLSDSAQVGLLEMLIPIAESDPAAMSPLLELLGHSFRNEDDERILVRAGWALSLSGEAYPNEVAAAIADNVEPAFTLLDGDLEARAAGAALLSYVAEYQPELLGSRQNELREHLDDEHESVRTSILWALGALGASEELFEEIAHTDESELVRNVATALLHGDANVSS